jgi:hypothetical protein
MPEKAPKKHMNCRPDLHLKGIISLTVILMFTVALIAGQARANLPAEASASSDFNHAGQMNIVLDAKSLQKIDALPHVINTILALPIDIELRINGRLLRTDVEEDAGSDDASVQ